MASWESASIRCVSQGDGLVSKSGLANPTEGRNRLPDSLPVGGYKLFTVSDSRCRCCAENPLQTSTVLSHHCC